MQANPISAKPAASPSVGTGEDFRARQKREVDANFAVFKSRLNELLRDHAGEYALMHGGEFVEFFDGFNDAVKVGRLLYGDGVFSVQKVSQEKLDLGYWNHALLHAPR